MVTNISRVSHILLFNFIAMGKFVRSAISAFLLQPKDTEGTKLGYYIKFFGFGLDN